MSKYKSRQSRKVTPWDHTETRTPTQQFLFNHYKSHYDERHPMLTATGEDALINSFIPETCPHCGGVSFQKYGKTGNNVQRYKRNDCGKTFTPVTDTIFDSHKISISEWMEYTLNILRYVSINADSWNNKNAFTTSRYWLEKLFLVLDAQENCSMLSGLSGLMRPIILWRQRTFSSSPMGLGRGAYRPTSFALALHAPNRKYCAYSRAMGSLRKGKLTPHLKIISPLGPPWCMIGITPIACWWKNWGLSVKHMIRKKSKSFLTVKNHCTGSMKYMPGLRTSYTPIIVLIAVASKDI